MSVFDQLATSLGRRDEAPNQALAASITEGNDKAAIAELVAIVNGKDKTLQSDAIKVLYEVGSQSPKLIAEQMDLFLQLIAGKNNRLIWGAMVALDAIATVNPAGIFSNLPAILKAADSGSVITRDASFSILVKLSQTAQFRDECFPLLMDQMQRCPPNQFPMYAESAAAGVVASQKAEFLELLNTRLPDLPKESQQKRIEKVLKKLTK